MRKYIALLASTWAHDYLSALVKGVSERIENEDIGLHIFNAYDDIIEKEFYTKDKEIFSLPCFDNYMGMIAVFNSVDSANMMNQLITEFAKTGKPVLSIDQHVKDVPFFGLDNYNSMYSIIEHMIDEHGCKTLNYVGGPEDNEENNIRYRAYVDCLNDHGIEVDPARVRHYRFTTADGHQAYYDFREVGKHLPDCVVSANDFMAFGYISAAESEGYVAPEDYKIIGFDNVSRGQNCLPSITSVNRNWEQLGFDAAEGIIHMANTGEKVMQHHTLGYVKINESCGCKCERDIKHDYIELFASIRIEQQRAGAHAAARKALCSGSNLDNFRNAMYKSRQFLHVPGYVIALNDSFFDPDYEVEVEGFSNTMTAYLEDSIEQLDIRKGLVPDVYHDGKEIYMFAALHLDNQTFGYCIMPYEHEFLSNGGHRTLMESLSLALAGVKKKMSIDRMNVQLKQLYVQDAMTGLYNRFGYNEFADEYYRNNSGNIYIMCIDLDNLKTINDKYGHVMGDVAIKGVAYALKKVFPGSELKIRMGGDEFAVIGKYESDDEVNERIALVENALNEYASNNRLPYELAASIGFVGNKGLGRGVTIELLSQWADQKMYAVKQSHHEN